MGHWFLTICVAFQQSLELFLTSLSEIQALGAKSLSWVERFELCELASTNSKP
jgi:hypothetical protein